MSKLYFEDFQAGNVAEYDGKLVTAEEVAWVVAFLASPRSISITGDAVVTGGGLPGAVHY